MNSTRKRPPLLTALLFLSVVSVLSLLLVVARRPPLTSGDVRHNAHQLEQLAAWTTLLPAAAEATTQVTYTFGGPCGRINGLALIEQWERSGGLTQPETHLWFSVVRDETRWFRSVSRPPLPSAVILRNDLNSDLVATGSSGHLTLTIEPLIDGPVLGGVLTVNNLAGDDAMAFNRTSNRWLTTAAQSSHCHFTELDLDLFSVLTKVLRGRICGSDGDSRPCDDVALTIFRGREGGTYGIHLRALGRDGGVLPFTLEITRYRDGPQTAVLRLRRSQATLDRAASLYVVVPRPQGEMLSPEDPGFIALHYRPDQPETLILEGQIDFDRLLAGTTWR